MPVLATPVGNIYNHISYLVFCPETGEATAVDPYHVDLTLDTARSRNLRITQIVNTHEHWDHAGRNDQIQAETGAKAFASKAAAGVIEKLDVMLKEGDEVRVGTTHVLQVLETPGHTMTHICLLGEDGGRPFLLCGDTLFGAGVGNCGYGGHAPTLFQTIERLRALLAPTTRLYPGHDYLARNLGFTLRYEPGNGSADALVESARQAALFTTLADELQINLFLRLESEALREGLIEEGHVGADPDKRNVFLALRRLRDDW